MTLSASDQAAVEALVVRWRVLIFIDFDGDPVRVTTGLYDKTISGSGDSELDGSYSSIDHRFLNVGDVQQSESGNEKVEVTLSGLPDDTSLFTVAEDVSKWQGRTVRIWFYMVDENEALVDEYNAYYTGYIDDLIWNGDAGYQTVTVQIENYLNTLSGASNKNYLMQTQFDSGDLSPLAIIASANGLGGGGTNTYGGGSGGSRGFEENGRRGLQEY